MIRCVVILRSPARDSTRRTDVWGYYRMTCFTVTAFDCVTALRGRRTFPVRSSLTFPVRSNFLSKALIALSDEPLLTSNLLLNLRLV
ncbi:hypothetical protein AVEN_123863-1 [Araneus ventricosus]|uniref:Uncharacterized protein n=1 Tax=Araneus ventricosus TaxID=182803 RepID=A0A4Y2GE29_ARAVE|nr:hypothetical protein AVEN_123863-1 [Araneus ventricosus]